MNFLAHFVIAARSLTPTPPLPFYVVGNALPDLLTLADRRRRLRPSSVGQAPAATPEGNALRAGALAHLITDAAFHKTVAFADAQARLNGLIAQANFADMRVRRFFLAHVLVELALDAVLLRGDATLADNFYRAFSAAPPPQVAAWTETTLGTPLPTLPGVLTRFAASRYLLSYAHDDGVAEGLSRVSVKARQDAFVGDNRRRLVGLVSQAVPIVAALTPALLHETVSALPVQPPTTEK